MLWKLTLPRNAQNEYYRYLLHRITALLLAAWILHPTIGSVNTALSAEKTSVPNIILMMSDDLGYGDLSCFNEDSPIKTPHLSEMAAAGLKFTRFYAAAPVCSPTRGSCLTGRHPYRYGIYTANVGHLKQEEIALPELLHEVGYATGHFGKWHLGTLTTEIKDANRGGPKNKQHFSPPQQHGYDVCFVTESKVPTFDPLIAPVKNNGKAWDPLVRQADSKIYGTHYWNERGEIVSDDLSGDDSELIMDRAIPFIENATKNHQPFFAVIWFHAPHLPVVADRKSQQIYPDASTYERNYYGCVSALDDQVGRLRKSLRDLQVDQNTMLWFCSDNGPEGQANSAPGSAGILSGRKRSLLEGGIRVPGLLEWPAVVTPGTDTDFAVVTSDYLPTILDALQLEYPDNRPLDGISLLPLLQEKSLERKQPIGFQSGPQVAWMSGNHKIYTKDRGKKWQLYDLKADPEESLDLAAQEPELLKSMILAARQWQESCRKSDEEQDYK